MNNKNDKITYSRPTFLSLHKNEKSFLSDVVPLSTPLSCYISISDYCNLKCDYCIYGCKMQKDIFNKFREMQTMMSLEMFKRIIDSFNFEEKIKSIKFVGIGETLTNKEFPKMVKYLKESGITKRIELLTNGVLLTHEMSLEIVDAGLDELQISVNGLNSDDYKRVSGVAIDFDAFVSNVKFLYENRKQCRVYCKTVNVAVEGREQLFEQIFGGISDLTYIEFIYPLFKPVEYTTNDGTIGLLGDKITNPSKMCPNPFYRFLINPNGDLSFCTPDILRELKFGNANVDDLCALWNGEKLNRFRKRILEGRISEYKICDGCSQMSMCVDMYEGNRLDEAAERLLNEYYKDF